MEVGNQQPNSGINVFVESRHGNRKCDKQICFRSWLLAPFIFHSVIQSVRLASVEYLQIGYSWILHKPAFVIDRQNDSQNRTCDSYEEWRVTCDI